MRRAAAAFVLCGMAVALAPAIQAYLKFGVEVGNTVVPLAWPRMPIQYFVTNRSVSGVTASDLQAVAARSFQSWSSAANTQLSAQSLGLTGLDPGIQDGMSVIGFLSRPDQPRTLGATNWVTDRITGELLESDIYINTIRQWSVAPGGDPQRFDLESVVVHEVGHLLGLGHSAIGETELQGDGGRRVLGKRAVMFPIAYPAGNITDRTLESDDLAGITDIYPASGANQLGQISGRVVLNGSGIFGAHVTAFNSTTGQMIGGFALNSRGDFVISNLDPGLYVVRAEPLDDGDIASFFGDSDVNINFKATFFNKLVAVPAGGTSGSIEIRVQPK